MDESHAVVIYVQLINLSLPKHLIVRLVVTVRTYFISFSTTNGNKPTSLRHKHDMDVTKRYTRQFFRRNLIKATKVRPKER